MECGNGEALRAGTGRAGSRATGPQTVSVRAAADHRPAGLASRQAAVEALRTGDHSGLDSVAEVLRRALAASPAHHPDHAEWLNALGAAL